MVWLSTWTDADDAALIHKREVECKGMPAAALEMGRALRSCYDRYAKLVAARSVAEPIIVIAEPTPRPERSFHAKLGIKTFVHRQAVLTELSFSAGKRSEDGWGYDKVNRCWSNSHLFRASVTLPRIWP